MSSAYHPQTDGQTERVNRCIETYLRCFSSTQPKQWKRWLAWGEWSYNTAFHKAIKMTPFEAVYGYSPPSIETYVRGTTNAHHVEQELLTRDRILRLLQENLSIAQARTKAQADKRHSEWSFEVGDFVYIRLQPHRQSSVAISSSTKLAPQYYGPYRILDRIGPVAYTLELPASSRIHPVFHVSCLKKKLGKFISSIHQFTCLHRYGAS